MGETLADVKYSEVKIVEPGKRKKWVIKGIRDVWERIRDGKLYVRWENRNVPVTVFRYKGERVAKIDSITTDLKINPYGRG